MGISFSGGRFNRSLAKRYGGVWNPYTRRWELNGLSHDEYCEIQTALAYRRLAYIEARDKMRATLADARNCGLMP